MMREWVFVILLSLMLFCLAAISILWPVESQELPRSYGHPADMHKDFYDQSCCNKQDCEPVPDSAVQLGTDGQWHIRYWSTQLDMLVEGTLPYDQAKNSNGCIKAPDGTEVCTHGCARPKQKQCGGSGMSPSIYGCGIDISKPATPICIYIPSVT